MPVFRPWLSGLLAVVSQAADAQAADGPFMLAPGTSAGSKTSAGAIPLAVVDQVRPQSMLDPTAGSPWLDSLATSNPTEPWRHVP